MVAQPLAGGQCWKAKVHTFLMIGDPHCSFLSAWGSSSLLPSCCVFDIWGAIRVYHLLHIHCRPFMFIFIHHLLCLLVPSTWPRRWWEIFICYGLSRCWWTGREGLLTGVLPLSLHGYIPRSVSLSSDLCRCWTCIVVVESMSSLSSNPRHHHQICIILIKSVESASWWLSNPPHRHQNHIVVVDPHPRRRLRIMVVDLHPRWIRIMVVNLHPHHQNRIVVVESTSSSSKPHCGCRIHVVVIESASWLSIHVLIIESMSLSLNPRRGCRSMSSSSKPHHGYRIPAL